MTTTHHCSTAIPHRTAGASRSPAMPRIEHSSRQVKAAPRGAPSSTKLVRRWREVVRVEHLRRDLPATSSIAARDEIRLRFEAAWERLADVLDPVITRQAYIAANRSYIRPLEVSEVVQEAYLRLLKNGASNMTRCAASTDAQLVVYLGRVCSSCVADLMRLRGASKRGEDATVSLRHDAEEKTADPLQDVEMQAICRSELAGFRRAISTCAAATNRHSARNRWILEETLIFGRRSTEFASDLGMTPSSVNSVVFRLRRSLRQSGWPVASQCSR